MSLEPPPTLVKLDPAPGRWLRAGMWAALSAGAAWLWDRPTDLVSILMTCIVGGAAFWFGLGPGLHGLRNHRNLAVQVLAVLGSLALIYFTMNQVIPFVQAYVAAAVQIQRPTR